ncbi:MAG: DUF5666 domain-containing protein [Acidiferrobacterales bacterium]|nr:DUF5666 domain-containing protein [Acidiferrobacterales bacterium]
MLIVGAVSFVGSDFVSVLGQTVFLDQKSLAGLRVGSSVAVYGSLDFDTGGIMNASVIHAASAGFGSDAPSFLTGFVDAVNYSKGTAVVSGMTVDYTALLSDGSAPNVGDQVSVTGREYAGLGVLVADPQLRIGKR